MNMDKNIILSYSEYQRLTRVEETLIKDFNEFKERYEKSFDEFKNSDDLVAIVKYDSIYCQNSIIYIKNAKELKTIVEKNIMKKVNTKLAHYDNLITSVMHDIAILTCQVEQLDEELKKQKTPWYKKLF